MVHGASRGSVDHRQAAMRSQNFYESLLLFRVILRRDDIVGEVRPVKASDDRLGISERELAHDVTADLGRCGGGEGDRNPGSLRLVNPLYSHIAGQELTT